MLPIEPAKTRTDIWTRSVRNHAPEISNTNMGAMIALQSLDSIVSQPAGLQKRVCTGLPVAGFTDERHRLCDGAIGALQAASCDGQPLITGSSGSFARVAIAHATFSGAAPDGSIASPQFASASSVALITATGGFVNQQMADGVQLNTIGDAVDDGNPQITHDNDKIALNSGIGALGDADLDKESAQLTALQLRQQLGAQVANWAPQTLLSLFK
jgi:hypothetical protein